MERGVYFDAWFPRQHCYHPSLPPRRLRMVDDLVDYRATLLVWASMGGGSLALPYLEQEAFGPVSARDRFYGFVNDSEFIAACHEKGIKVFGIVFEAQGWEFPVELNDDETQVLALNELRGVGHRGWLGLREFSGNRYPGLWPAFESYFPDGMRNSAGEPVTNLIEECVARDIHQAPCHAHWVECPDREHQCFYMDRNNPVWREYLKGVIRIQIDAGVDGIQLDEAELPLGAMQYGACFCRDCMHGFRGYLAGLPSGRLPAQLAEVDLSTFHYGEWLLGQGFDFKNDRQDSPLFDHYYNYQCGAVKEYFAELAAYAREYGHKQGREVLVSGNFFNLDPHYLPLADDVDLIITEMRNTAYRQPEWYRYVDAFARYAGGKDVVVVENPYGGVVPELVKELNVGRGYDLMRLSLYEGAAFGTNMTVPYGSWMGSRIEDSFYAPHDLLTQVQDFLADHDQLFSQRSANEIGVVYSIPSNRELVSLADASDNVYNARDASVQVPYRVVTEALSRASAPFDVVLFTDGELAEDRLTLDDLQRYRVVVLPSCWLLTDHQVDVLVSYLDGGGRVVITGEVAVNLDSEQAVRLRGHRGTSTSELANVDALQPHGPQVRIAPELGVNLHVLGEGGVAVHLVNYGYDRVTDAVTVQRELEVTVRLDTPRTRAVLVAPGRPDQEVALRVEGTVHTVLLESLNAYAVLMLHNSGSA